MWTPEQSAGPRRVLKAATVPIMDANGQRQPTAASHLLSVLRKSSNVLEVAMAQERDNEISLGS